MSGITTGESSIISFAAARTDAGLREAWWQQVQTEEMLLSMKV